MSRAPRTDAGSFRLRAWFVFGVLTLSAGGLLLRAVDLQLFEHEFLAEEGEQRFVRAVTTVANRGAIVDRNGELLAFSTPVESAWADARELSKFPELWPDLARAMQRKPAAVASLISSNADNRHLWLGRLLTPSQAQAVRKLAIPSVHMAREYKRYFPAGEVVAHVVGFTNVDDQGQEGTELLYDSWLEGQGGFKRVIQDRRGRRVGDVENIRTAIPGRDLALSLDLRIQYLAHRELKAAIEANRAESGSMVVIDITTGEILAMANLPTFNPNNRAKATKAMFRNIAVIDMLEPGSSIKPFVVAAALESGRFDAADVIDVSDGYIDVGTRRFKDEHPEGLLNLAGVLAKSSNVGMIKIASKLEPVEIYTTLTRLGFGRVTGSRFPGESAGGLTNYGIWKPIGIATMSFGYGLQVTPLQLAQAYAAVGALGVMRPVTLLRQDEVVPGEQVLSEHNARTLIGMLESVVQDGTGSRAAIPGYRVAGKTGTARKAGEGGYDDNRHTAVFGGLAPASNPRLAAVVVIDEPAAGRYYGGEISAPVFSSVVGGALRLMGVPPDGNANAVTDPDTGVSTMVTR
jgi:cell division protein FtsI (penicillin-binding protein 3)